MTSAAAATPFSLTMEQERAGANGFEVPHAISEFIDNAFDADSPGFTLALVPHTDDPTGPATLIGFDTGEGARDLDALYSIGTTVLKKTGPSRGLKNYGNRAAMGRLMPSNIVHMSRHRTAAYASTLIFKLADLYAAIDAEKRATGTCDYRRVDATITATNILQRNVGGGVTPLIRDTIIDPLRARIATLSPETYSSLATILTQIVDNTIAGYHLMLLQYDTFPPELESAIAESFKTYRLIYYKAFQNGLSIHFLRPSGAISYNTVTDAVDPLGTTHPRLTGHLEFRGDTMVCFTVTDGPSPAACYWLTCNPTDPMFYDGRTKRGPFRETSPAEWEAAPITGRLGFACAVLDKDTEEAQHEAIGNLIYRSTNDLRGVYLRFMDRILGPPLCFHRWNEPRNSSPFRVELSCDNHAVAEKFYNIQTKKHSATYVNLHRVLQTALNWIVNRVIIGKYSDYKICTTGVKGECPGVTDWKFTSRFRHWMMNTEYTPLPECNTCHETVLRCKCPPPPPPPVPVCGKCGKANDRCVCPGTACTKCGRITGCVCPPPVTVMMCSTCGKPGGAAHICIKKATVAVAELEPFVCGKCGAVQEKGHICKPLSICSKCGENNAKGHTCPSPPEPPKTDFQKIFDEAKFLYIDSNLEDLCEKPTSKLTKTQQAALLKVMEHLTAIKTLYPKIGIKRA